MVSSTTPAKKRPVIKKWVDLTDEEIAACHEAALLFKRESSDKEFWAITFGKALSLKLKEKNK